VSDTETETQEPAQVPGPDETGEPDTGDEPDTVTEDDEPDELEPEQPAEDRPPAPAPQTPEQMERQQQRLEKETERHVKRVAELVGDDFSFLVPCELCHPLMPGFRLPREPEDEVKEAVRYAIGDRQPENWQPDQYSSRCVYCDGLGEVLTGSRVRGKETAVCLGCDGKGWQPIGNERRGGYQAPPAEQVPENGGAESVATAEDDDPMVAELKRRGYVVIATEGAR